MGTMTLNINKQDVAPGSYMTVVSNSYTECNTGMILDVDPGA